MSSTRYANPLDPVVQQVPWVILGDTITIEITQSGLMLVDGCLVETSHATAQATVNEVALREQLTALANEAGRTCSQSHDLYVENFSASVDGLTARLPEPWSQRVLEMARTFDYATAQERAESQNWNAEHGYCSHGIELGSCPAGCGSGPDD